MASFLEYTLAHKMAHAISQSTYIPDELNQKNPFMDDVVIQHINASKKEFDIFGDDMGDHERSVVAMSYTYSNLKTGKNGNPFLTEHINSFKSEGSFIGYYKGKLGLNDLDIIG